MPRFSIIVPMYNVERYVGECLDSLRRQGFTDFEAVCVNDGSSDSTFARAKAAAAGDARFVFVERENGGLSAARNTGLEVASGEFVCFLDSDDRYAPDALEQMDRAIASGGLDLLDFNAGTFYESEAARAAHEESYDYREPIPGVHDGQGLFAQYWSRVQFVASACFHAIRREMLVERGLSFCEGLLHEDELFAPQLYAAAKRAAYLDAQLYERRVRMGSIMAAPASVKRASSLFAIVQMLHAWMLENAGEFTPAFVDALAFDIAFVQDAAFNAARQLGDAELEGYLASLDIAARAEFDLVVRYAGVPADMRFQDIAGSRDYRVGQLALAAPRALKHAIANMKR